MLICDGCKSHDMITRYRIGVFTEADPGRQPQFTPTKVLSHTPQRLDLCQKCLDALVVVTSHTVEDTLLALKEGVRVLKDGVPIQREVASPKPRSSGPN
jgi:hypothetical protein